MKKQSEIDREYILNAKWTDRHNRTYKVLRLIPLKNGKGEELYEIAESFPGEKGYDLSSKELWTVYEIVNSFCYAVLYKINLYNYQPTDFEKEFIKRFI